MRVDDIAGQFGIAFGSPFSRVPFHPAVLALDIAKAISRCEKSAVIGSTSHAYFADFVRRVNESDPLQLRRLRRSGRKWPRSRSTKCRDEIAPSHLPRLRRCSTHCPNYSNLERPARHKWHLPVPTLAKSMSEGSKTEGPGFARHVRFTLRSRHRQPATACPFGAIGL